MYRFRPLFAILIVVAFGVGCSPSADEQARSSRGFALPQGSVQDGRQAIVELRCTTCHEVHGLEDELPRPTATPIVGVKLGGLLPREPTDGELLTSIINPTHRINTPNEQQNVSSDGESRMARAGLNATMTVQQMIDIVAFLHDRYETVQ